MSTALLMILYLAFLEILLSVDNALVLASIVKNNLEDPEERKKALQYGIWGAYLFRLVIIFVGVWLISFTLVKFLAAAYLIFISVKELFFKKDKEGDESPNLIGSFWKTVIMIELMDLAFSVDSIAVGLSISDSKIILIIGAIIGITAMRYCSTLLIRVLELFPQLEKIAFVLVLLAGFKILLGTFGYHITEGYYILVSILTVICYYYGNKKYQEFIKAKL